jgi:hypothetical protein
VKIVPSRSMGTELFDSIHAQMSSTRLLFARAHPNRRREIQRHGRDQLHKVFG